MSSKKLFVSLFAVFVLGLLAGFVVAQSTMPAQATTRAVVPLYKDFKLYTGIGSVYEAIYLGGGKMAIEKIEDKNNTQQLKFLSVDISSVRIEGFTFREENRRLIVEGYMFYNAITVFAND